MITLQCGCEFEEINGKINLDCISEITYGSPRLKCQATWDLISSGDVKGLFQVEKSLGKRWCKEIKPQSIDELADITALIRPGCLKAVHKGKSVPQYYADIKHGLEEEVGFHESVDDILSPTKGVLIYQEQAMMLAQRVAGFDLQQADDLRKAAGKKLADKMAEVKKIFLKGSKKEKIIPYELAEELFGWIEKSQRYSFNKSHAVAYATNSFWSAYCKTHALLEFYCSWLQKGLSKQDPFEEILELVNDAKVHDVEVNTANFRRFYSNFNINGNDIEFGLSALRGIGGSEIVKMKAAVEEAELLIQKSKNDWTWLDFLVVCGNRLSKTVIEGLIWSGSLKFEEDRGVMQYEYEKYKGLTKTEASNLTEYYKNSSTDFKRLVDLIKIVAKPKKEGGICHNKNRVEILSSLVDTLTKSSYNVVSTPGEIGRKEKELLGIPLTCSEIDEYDTHENCTCREFIQGIKLKDYILAVTIHDSREIKIKNGKNRGQKMSFVSASDSTGMLSCLILFSEAYEKYQDLLEQDNIVGISGNRSKDKDSLIVNKVWQIA